MQDTLPEILRPLMEIESVKSDHCVICGRVRPLNNHHMVRRGAGRMYVDGRELEKPVITLCGIGNTCGCHGLAHANRLHFRNHDGVLEYIILPEPTKYQKALDMKGWSKVADH